MLLSRDEFREAVFERDSNLCVVCGALAKDAHHIIERRLWPDGGYYLDNGVSLCEKHHIEAEQTTLSVEYLRQCSRIKKVILPPHMYKDQIYDKWGNIILNKHKRVKGELFNDESVQRILPQSIKDTFLPYVKYPRTWRMPSEEQNKSDRYLKSLNYFKNQRIIITEKMDGENTTLYSDYFHARSIDGNEHPSQSWIKGLQAYIGPSIPDEWRICGENLYATHSIKYDKLESYFLLFSIWDENNVALSWDDTVEWASLLGLYTVPVLYDGEFDDKKIQEIIDGLDTSSQEGIVIRLASEFNYREFFRSVAKWVRPNHMQETVHNWKMCWDSKKINKLV